MPKKEVIYGDDLWKPSIIYDRLKRGAEEQGTRYIDYHVDIPAPVIDPITFAQSVAASQEYQEFYGWPIENRKASVGYQGILDDVKTRTKEGVLSQIDQQAYDRWLTQALQYKTRK